MTLGKWMGVVALTLSLYILWQIRQLILLIFTAVVIANALNILVRKLQRFNFQRWLAVVISVLILLISSITFVLVIVPPVIGQLEELFQLVPEGIGQLDEWLIFLEEQISPEISEFLPTIEQIIQQIQPIFNRLLGEGLTFFYTTVGIILNILLVLVLSIMLLADPTPYRKGFIRLFPSFYRRRVDEILLLCEKSLQGWLVGTLFSITFLLILSFIGLSILGIDLALAQAMLTGLLTFIPNFGPVLSVIPPTAIALLDAPWKSLAVLIFYIILQQVEGSLLTPLVMAQQVSLFPAFTLLAQVFFATFFGFLGLFLALPLTVVCQIWIQEVLIKDVLDNWTGNN
ncbi:AI-2E family transporter [Euhalothece natronophila Z-M001]|uniref:AI-2E family transporter n=1 Tax=Euhalothece natronophila Z-M001 TaxID=522448 RepID=A0A5B8NKV3_9CHRO|nr:AI-2E family transporter [Euhalothece natronophila]QDZ39882.1 AI-2E family transporter [Euhalothece natronophila Z-M001]